MNKSKLFFWAFVAALGGFLFGFDVAVISGAEQAIQKLWSLNNIESGLLVGAGLFGTIVGAFFGSWPAEKYGRKPMLVWIGILFLICSVGCALAQGPLQFILARFIGGVAVGASSVVAPVFISEISPTKDRGRLTAMFQFCLVLGIMSAYLTNYLIGGGEGEAPWRMMLGIMAVPSAIYLLLSLGLPESPRWLIAKKGDVGGARKILAQIDPTGGSNGSAWVEKEVADISAAHEKTQSKAGLAYFFSGKFNKMILLAFLFAMFNQLSGINAIIYYAPRILEGIGLEKAAALFATFGVGVVNVIFTMLGLQLIDRMGRRKLMFIGSIGYILSLAGVAYAFYSGTSGAFVPVLLLVFIASHAIGQGAVIWVFISEIFPNEIRAYGNSIGSGTHWVFAAIVGTFFPAFNEAFGGAKIFGFFAVMMVFQLLFVWKMMPETKGVSLEELEKKLVK